MAPNLPKLLALLVNSYGLFIFRNPTSCIVHQFSTLVPSLIFAVGVYIFAIDVAFFKVGYRRVFVPCQFVLEFLATVFLLETALLDFWFPLEKFILSQLAAAAGMLKTYHCLGLSTTLCCILYTTLRSPVTAAVSSYCLSCFFLSCVMQGTNIIDFRILRCGVDVFVQTLVKRVRRGSHLLWPYKGMKQPGPARNSCRCDCSTSRSVVRPRRR